MKPGEHSIKQLGPACAVYCGDMIIKTFPHHDFNVNYSKCPNCGNAFYSMGEFPNQKVYEVIEQKGSMIMDFERVMKLVEDEMVCANGCPMFHQSPYNLSKCTCYKKDVLDFLWASKRDVLAWEQDRASCKNPVFIKQKNCLFPNQCVFFKNPAPNHFSCHCLTSKMNQSEFVSILWEGCPLRKGDFIFRAVEE